MRVLFVMEYPGYLRYYDSTVRLLAERGHDVQLVWDLPSKQAEGLRALEAMPESVRDAGPLPKRKDGWAPLATALRRGTDALRYLDPQLAGAAYLRRRTARVAPAPFRALARLPRLPRPVVRALLRVLGACERAIPSSPRLEAYVREASPDLIVVTPLVTDASRQTDVIKAARALDVPVALGVASWDHLTTKGLIRLLPDRVLLWNEIQREEARMLHRVPDDRIVVTGAQNFDRWFEREPRPRAEFCARAGLPDDRPYVLFVGSTASISEPGAELDWVRSWIGALRSAGDERVRELAVLVRPHPYNVGRWTGADTSGLGPVAVYPTHGANPVDEDDRADYFDSMHHAAAVVGINTSAMIEAAIVGRPVLTVQTPEFSETQGGSLHFHYMRPEQGGFLAVADGLDTHVEQLAARLADPAAHREQAERFVESFVRPHGRAQAATPFVVDALEEVARARAGATSGRAAWTAPLRWALWPAAQAMRAGALRRSR